LAIIFAVVSILVFDGSNVLEVSKLDHVMHLLRNQSRIVPPTDLGRVPHELRSRINGTGAPTRERWTVEATATGVRLSPPPPIPLLGKALRGDFATPRNRNHSAYLASVAQHVTLLGSFMERDGVRDVCADFGG
jgi:hypothetical protein